MRWADRCQGSVVGMFDPFGNPRWTAARGRAAAVYRSRRLRKSLLILVIALVVYGLLGFLAAPPIIRQQIETRASAALSRPVALAAVHLNPYTHVSYTHLRAHETGRNLVCRLL